MGWKCGLVGVGDRHVAQAQHFGWQHAEGASVVLDEALGVAKHLRHMGVRGGDKSQVLRMLQRQNLRWAADTPAQSLMKHEGVVQHLLELAVSVGRCWLEDIYARPVPQVGCNPLCSY